jgi:very-short-patch-repair endonuclease
LERRRAGDEVQNSLIPLILSPRGRKDGSWMIELDMKEESEKLDSRIKTIRLAKPVLWALLSAMAREMRQAPTAAENALRQELRGRKLCGVKFRRQHTIDRFIVDFFSAEADLIIEVDGDIHDYSKEEDKARQAFLESLGYKVFRFSNEQVLNHMIEVLDEIKVNLSR